MNSALFTTISPHMFEVYATKKNHSLTNVYINQELGTVVRVAEFQQTAV